MKKACGNFLFLLIISMLMFSGCNGTLNELEDTFDTTFSNNTINNDDLYSDTVLDDKLYIHFIDVGQADCILIKNSNYNILIDGGEGKSSKDVINYLKELNITKLDYIFATHPHSDHIGGLPDIINNFEISNIVMPKVTHNTKTFENLLDAIENKNLLVNSPKPGEEIILDNLKLTTLAPISTKYEDLNNYSIVLKAQYGDTSFLLTGDMEKLSENEVINAGYNVKSDVLKVAHHGSSTGSTIKFLEAISPRYAIISLGVDNSYGHPHKETLSNLGKIEAIIYRTDENGTIVAISDGKSINFETENSTTTG